jgi:hypothetical protein
MNCAFVWPYRPLLIPTVPTPVPIQPEQFFIVNVLSSRGQFVTDNFVYSIVECQ